MSQENVELSRGYFDGIARTSQEGLDPEATISKMVKFWDPEIEWDTSETTALDISGVYQGCAARALHRHRGGLGEARLVTIFGDGLVVHQKLYMSQSEALEAVGLSE